MENNKILEAIAAAMKVEISNKLFFNENEILIILADGTKAKVTTKEAI